MGAHHRKCRRGRVVGSSGKVSARFRSMTPWSAQGGEVSVTGWFVAGPPELAVDVVKRSWDGPLGSSGETETDSVVRIGVGILSEDQDADTCRRHFECPPDGVLRRQVRAGRSEPREAGFDLAVDLGCDASESVCPARGDLVVSDQQIQGPHSLAHRHEPSHGRRRGEPPWRGPGSAGSCLQVPLDRRLISSSARSCATWAVREVSLSAAIGPNPRAAGACIRGSQCSPLWHAQVDRTRHATAAQTARSRGGR